MSITRFHPPYYPDTHEHIPMDKSARGRYVLYKDHEIRINILKKEIEELRAKIAESGASE
jgi:hypothetical protein